MATRRPADPKDRSIRAGDDRLDCAREIAAIAAVSVLGLIHPPCGKGPGLMCLHRISCPEVTFETVDLSGGQVVDSPFDNVVYVPATLAQNARRI